MKTQNSKTLRTEVRQAAECLAAHRGAFKELALRSGMSQAMVSKWSKGSRNSDLLTELASALCKEIRKEGGLRIFVAKSSARAAVANLRGKSQ